MFLFLKKRNFHKIDTSSGPKGKNVPLLKELSMNFHPKLYKLDIKIIKIFLIYLLEVTKMKTKLYQFPQDYKNYDRKPNFKHLYHGFHK